MIPNRLMKPDILIVLCKMVVWKMHLADTDVLRLSPKHGHWTETCPKKINVINELWTNFNVKLMRLLTNRDSCQRKRIMVKLVLCMYHLRNIRIIHNMDWTVHVKVGKRIHAMAHHSPNLLPYRIQPPSDHVVDLFYLLTLCDGMHLPINAIAVCEVCKKN